MQYFVVQIFLMGQQFYNHKNKIFKYRKIIKWFKIVMIFINFFIWYLIEHYWFYLINLKLKYVCINIHHNHKHMLILSYLIISIKPEFIPSQTHAHHKCKELISIN